jgi:KDO2-lipid IV(A) lauroyltransferase
MVATSGNAGKSGSYAYRLATWVTSKTPHKVLTYAARAGGWIHYWMARRKRHDYLANTSQFVDFKKNAQPWRAFQNHALNILELLKATSESDSVVVKRLTLRGAEHIDAALRQGHGLILTTFHSGNWELSGLLLALSGYRFTTVAGTQLRAGWSEEIKEFKERFGINVVSPSASMRGLYRDLWANRIVVLHIDGDVFAGGIEATLLGKTVKVPRGPAHLSRVTGAPTAFAYCRRAAGDKLNVFIETPQAPPKTVGEEYHLTRGYVGRLEKCILEDPGQWCIFRRL